MKKLQKFINFSDDYKTDNNYIPYKNKHTKTFSQKNLYPLIKKLKTF